MRSQPVGPVLFESGVIDFTETTWTGLNVSLAHRMVFRERPTIAELTPNSAAPGSEVTITGTGFDDTTEVFFGDAAAEFTIVSDTEITAVVPALEAGSTVMVGVVSDGLTSAESPTALFSVPAAPVTPTPAPAQPGPTQPAAPGTHGETLPAVGSSASAQLALLAVGFGALGLALVSRAGRAGTARTRS
ncbi:IPT/TIG domain-containing protein [uncultured Aeromicrobium sp.]|uniref:IPT/TIG domain-containing protein n=1 Tax=uncultured Aeromicrobium sp. TaxID=337820 RepID=UPI0025EE76FD|nr:IPT/TIG domain-containing protein [uncultured Aeromicrobium sp.]